MKTGQQMVTDVIALLRGTALVGEIRGNVYREGTRPRDSVAEDCVVIFTTADAEQFQSGVVTLNIYVPDLLIGSNGVRLVDSARCEEIESMAQYAFEELTAAVSDYKFKLRDAIHTQRDEDINQSFVVVRLGFRHYD